MGACVIPRTLSPNWSSIVRLEMAALTQGNRKRLYRERRLRKDRLETDIQDTQFLGARPRRKRMPKRKRKYDSKTAEETSWLP